MQFPRTWKPRHFYCNQHKQVEDSIYIIYVQSSHHIYTYSPLLKYQRKQQHNLSRIANVQLESIKFNAYKSIFYVRMTSIADFLCALCENTQKKMSLARPFLAPDFLFLYTTQKKHFL
jgi:hypothetical protein